MKTYQQLTESEQAKARAKALDSLLTAICEGYANFSDCGDLQARIDTAGEKANAMQTPWFWPEYILVTCRDDLESIALCDAEESTYLEPANPCRFRESQHEPRKDHSHRCTV